MIRSPRAFVLSGLAVLALVALAAPAAQAEATFTVPGAGAKTQTTLTLLPDGSGKTTHWVFDVASADKTKSALLTCNEVLGNTAATDGLVTGPAFAEFTITTPAFSGCTINGQPAKAENKGCAFRYTSGGRLDIVKVGIHVCRHTAEPLVFTAASCTIEIGEVELIGVGYHTVEEAGIKMLTVEQNGIGEVTYEARGAACEFGTTSNGTITTGNQIVTGESTIGGAMVNFLWEP